MNKRNEWRKAQYERLKSEGRCARCGKADERTKSGKTCCAVCTDIHRNNRIKRYNRLKSENRCVLCGKQDNRTLKGKVCCFSCAVKQTQSQEKKGAAEGNGNSHTAAMTKISD